MIALLVSSSKLIWYSALTMPILLRGFDCHHLAQSKNRLLPTNDRTGLILGACRGMSLCETTSCAAKPPCLSCTCMGPARGMINRLYNSPFSISLKMTNFCWLAGRASLALLPKVPPREDSLDPYDTALLSRPTSSAQHTSPHMTRLLALLFTRSPAKTRDQAHAPH